MGERKTLSIDEAAYNKLLTVAAERHVDVDELVDEVMRSSPTLQENPPKPRYTLLKVQLKALVWPEGLDLDNTSAVLEWLDQQTFISAGIVKLR